MLKLASNAEMLEERLLWFAVNMMGVGSNVKLHNRFLFYIMYCTEHVVFFFFSFGLLHGEACVFSFLFFDFWCLSGMERWKHILVVVIGKWV